VHLLQCLPRLENAASPAAGELLLLLGRGLFETGRLTDAAKQITRAQQILPQTSPLQAEAGVLTIGIVYMIATLIADTEPGLYDQHGRRLDRPLLADVLPMQAATTGRFPFGKGKADYVAIRIEPDDPTAGADKGSLQALRRKLAEAGVVPDIVIKDSSGQDVNGLETHAYRNGNARRNCKAFSQRLKRITHNPEVTNIPCHL
jgi:hypothetical protein